MYNARWKYCRYIYERDGLSNEIEPVSTSECKEQLASKTLLGKNLAAATVKRLVMNMRFLIKCSYCLQIPKK